MSLVELLGSGAWRIWRARPHRPIVDDVVWAPRRLRNSWRAVVGAVGGALALVAGMLPLHTAESRTLCPRCRGNRDTSHPPPGEGWVEGHFDPCPRCDGTGFIDERSLYTVEAYPSEHGSSPPRTVGKDIERLWPARKLAKRALREAGLTRVYRDDGALMYEFRRKGARRRAS